MWPLQLRQVLVKKTATVSHDDTTDTEDINYQQPLELDTVNMCKCMSARECVRASVYRNACVRVCVIVKLKTILTYLISFDELNLILL